MFVGHNITGFDLPFLKKRSIILGICPPSVIPFAAKPWDKSVFDTMIQWDGDRDKRISLPDKLCKVLGIESPKGDMDGSKVGEYFRADGSRDCRLLPGGCRRSPGASPHDLRMN